MNDSISRHAALVKCYELKEARRHWDTEIGRAEIRGIDAAMCELNSLPSAQPERIRGRWGTTVASPTLIVCNRCGRTVLKTVRFIGISVPTAALI